MITRTLVLENSLVYFEQLSLLASKYIFVFCDISGPPLWSSGQSSWLQIQRSRVRSPALPDFLSSSGTGTGSTQPREPREVN